MEIELSAIWGALRKWFWVPLVLMVGLGILSFVIANNQEKVYTATSTLIVELSPGEAQNASVSSVASQLTDPYKLLLETETFRQQIAEQAGLPTIEGIEISIVVPSGSRFLNVRATHTDPETALNIANATADVIVVDYTTKSEARLDDTTLALNDEIASLHSEREIIAEEIATIEQSEETGSARHQQLTG